MSDRADSSVSGAVVRAITLALVLAPTAAVAQNAAAYKARLDSLVPVARAAVAAQRAAETARANRPASVLVRAGPLVLSADSAIAREVAIAATIAAPAIARTFGSAADQLGSVPIAAERIMKGRDGRDTLWMIRLGTGWTQAVSRVDSATTQRELLAALMASGPMPLHESLDEALREWFISPLPAGEESQDELAAAYIQLAAASVDATRRCLVADLHGCRQALGLADLSDPVVDGSTAAERRKMLQGTTRGERRRGSEADFERCIDSADDAACVRLLRAIGRNTDDRLALPALRRSFARWVIDQGGPDAYARLRSDSTRSVEARLAAAGRAPIDTLLAGWQRRIVSGRPPSAVPTFVTAGAALFWALAAGVLATRSSRWR